MGDAVRRVAALAAARNIELILPEEEQRKHGQAVAGARWQPGEGDGADLCVVLGGDGTTLRALDRFLGRDTPVFAINFGRVGFLTTAAPAALEPALGRAFEGDYTVVELPAIEVRRDGTRIGVAVNDAVVTSAIHGRMAHFRFRVRGVDLGEVGCDAMVVATPSGSTAYSLSAGGPVLSWGLDGVCITFVAPHSLTARSLVLPRGQLVEIENHGAGTDARLVLDGHVVADALEPLSVVAVRMAEEHANLALLPEVSFLQRYRDVFGSGLGVGG